jgi:hypothetical protein
MANIIPILPKPEIKCYDRDNMFCETRFVDTTETRLENVIKFPEEEEWLWTGESVHGICTHHVQQHCTVRDQYGRAMTIYCRNRSGNNENCNCGLFRTRSKKRTNLGWLYN